MIYTNIDQFINKRDDLCMLIAGDEPDLILLTEVIPKAQVHPIPPATLSLPDYTLYVNFDPTEANLGRGGSRGICIFVRSRWQATEVSFPNCAFSEHLWISIPLQNRDLLLVGCVYRSPSADVNTSTDNLINLLRTASEGKHNHLLVAGDINMPQIEWTSSFSGAPDGHHTHRFIEGIQECGLTQHVTKATRYREGERPSTLDVIMTNEEGLVQNLAYHPPIGNSDHAVLKCDVICYAQSTEPHNGRLNLNKGNYGLLNELIEQTDWNIVADASCPHQSYESLKEKLRLLETRCIPNACPKNKRRNIFINKEAIRLKNRKRKLWTAYTYTRDNISYARYVRCKNDLRRLTRNLRKNFERRLAANIKDNPKGFWRYASSRMKSRAGVENLRTATGDLTKTDNEKADILNSFFSSICTNEDPLSVPCTAGTCSGSVVEDVDLSAALVRKKMSEVRPSAAAGPDGIHPRVLRETASSLSPVLTTIFRQSLDSGSLPQDWKLADVVPIYKKGGKDDPGNYRPVSLTSVP